MRGYDLLYGPRAEHRAAVGLRTVDGSVQQPGRIFGGTNQTEFGAADNVFPRLTDPDVP